MNDLNLDQTPLGEFLKLWKSDKASLLLKDIHNDITSETLSAYREERISIFKDENDSDQLSEKLWMLRDLAKMFETLKPEVSIQVK